MDLVIAEGRDPASTHPFSGQPIVTGSPGRTRVAVLTTVASVGP